MSVYDDNHGEKPGEMHISRVIDAFGRVRGGDDRKFLFAKHGLTACRLDALGSRVVAYYWEKEVLARLAEIAAEKRAEDEAKAKAEQQHALHLPDPVPAAVEEPKVDTDAERRQKNTAAFFQMMNEILSRQGEILAGQQEILAILRPYDPKRVAA